MNQNMSVDMDPLSTYEYPGYDSYHPVPVNNLPNLPYPYDVKMEHPLMNQEFFNHFLHNAAENNGEEKILTNLNETTTASQPPNIDNDIKPEMQPITQKNVKKEKKTGKRSSYWSEKITDDGFKFYGCSICNISFSTLGELDQHVTVHKDRITSYDLKIKNLIRRKKLKKEQKKLKKLKKIKKEDTFEIPEIKPEDGYIGNEKTAEYNGENINQNGIIPSNTTGNPQDVKQSDCKENNDGNSSNNGGIGNNSNDPSKENNRGNSTNNGGIGNNSNDPSDPAGTDKNLEKIYKCFACQKQFTLSYYLKLHVRSHTDEKPYTCSVCGQSFITASKLGRHNKRIHLAIRFQCRICYRFFSKFENLTTHFDKKHADDKLEGEPYDYNAILPYLKELEEQLREKAENETKPKVELWDELWGPMPEIPLEEVKEPKKEEDSKNFDLPFQRAQPLDILIEEVKIDIMEVEVKKELEDPVPDEEHIAAEDFRIHDDQKADDDSLKDESCSRYSDSDYFPSNTWAASPPADAAPPSPPRTRRRGEGPLKCDVCNKSISTVSYMRVHMRTHTGEKPFKCYVCKRGFITSSKMHRHVLTHNETWEGEEAPVKLEEIKPDLSDDDETLDKKSRIKKAKAKFNRKPPRSEQPKKYKKRPHACEFCHKRFLHMETLLIHKKSHEGEDLVMKCNFCLESMPDEGSLREHEATHAGPKPFLCTVCGKSYKKRETMVYHRKHHKADKDYICNVCSKRFNAPCKLQRHLVSHRTDKFALRYECPVCAHLFHTKYHVQMHLQTHQKEGLILEENRNEILAMVLQNARKIPKQGSTGSGNATSNLTDLIPSDERSRVCNICGEIFQHFYYLEEHLKGHGSRIALEDITKPEEKKHVCQVCNKSFKLHYYLKLHSFTHTKEKPFICQQCGKGFITKGKLKRHLETHTGLKKYQCHICYKFFTRPSYLRIHVRTIHGTQDYNFRIDKGYAMNSMNMMGQQSI